MREFVKEYEETLKKLICKVNPDAISEIIVALSVANKNDKRVFVIGNGGSDATAAHFACDLGKNAVRGDDHRFKAISLCDSASFITAYGNDNGYENIFSEQLKNLMEAGDILVAISASGNSPNIIRAVEYAKGNRGTIIGLTGFNGGKLKELSDININVSDDSYERIEDVHMMITHIIVYYFKKNGV